MARPKCPTCHEPFDPQASPAMPFCSERCRLIDLGRWLNEEVGLPVDESEEDEYSGYDSNGHDSGGHDSGGRDSGGHDSDDDNENGAHGEDR